MQVEKDNSGFAADWKLDSIEIKTAAASDHKQHVTFAFYRWFSRKAGLQHTLHPAGKDELAARRAVTEYKIETITSDKRGAGTDAEVLYEHCTLLQSYRAAVINIFRNAGVRGADG